MKDAVNEKLQYINNEIYHYETLFRKKNITNLYRIIVGLKIDLKNINNYYQSIAKIIDSDLLNKTSNWRAYNELNIIKNIYINSYLNRIKHITFSIFDADLRRRLESIEVMKNHKISRALCNFFISNLNIDINMYVEAHFGYEAEYKWISLYGYNPGVINAPKMNAYCTRLLPILCHESMHPVINYYWNDILSDHTFSNLYRNILEYVIKNYLLKDNNYILKNAIQYASYQFSEIMCDLISTLICGQSYIKAFCSSLLYPVNIIHAKTYLDNRFWKTHPPNVIRFLLCNKMFNQMGCKKESKLMKDNWNVISNLQNNYPKNDNDIKLFNNYISDFMIDCDIKKIYEKFYTKNSPLRISKTKIPFKTIEKLTHNDKPLTIINSIWNSRYKRYESKFNMSDRNTTKVLMYLYSSLRLSD